METHLDLADTVDYIFFKKGQGFEKVFISDILFGEAKGSYTTVYTREAHYLVSRNLSYLFGRLSVFPDFVRVHRSYFVNIREVEKYFKEYLLVGEKHIPVSKTYRHDIAQRFIFF